MTAKLRNEDYRRLLEYRTAIRKFLDYSKKQAAEVDLTPTQHQLLLAIRGHRGPQGPTIIEVANCLLIRHHSAVELVNRAERARLVERLPDSSDHRLVRLKVTTQGAAKLKRISVANLREIRRLGPGFEHVWEAINDLTE